MDITSWIVGAAGLFAGFLLPLLGLAVTSYVLGRTATRRLPFASRLERVAVSTTLGLAFAAHLLLVLGLAGLLRPVPILLLAAAVHSVGIPAWRELLAEMGETRVRPAWLVLALLGLAPLVLLALYPPTAFDATLYHLPFARAFVESGGVPYLADRRFPVFPQANEMLFAGVMIFGRDVAAQGVQLLGTLLTAALIAAWGRELFPAFRAVGWLAAAVFLGNPIVVHFAGTAYVEPGLTLFAAASLFAADRCRRTGNAGWLALAAVFGATAADVKYLGLFFLGISGLIVLLAGRLVRSMATRLRQALLFAAIALVFLAPWYLRIYLHTGNPVFPYLTRMFGENPWQSPNWQEIAEPLAERLLRWARLPWDIVFERGRYNQEPPFSPVYLAALPLLAVGAVRERRVRALLGICGLYAFVFTWLPADSRYLVPVLPLASLAVAASAALAVQWWLGGGSVGYGPWSGMPFEASPPGPLSLTGEGEETKDEDGLVFSSSPSPVRERGPGGEASKGIPVRYPLRAVVVLCLVCVLPGWLYASYRLVRQGPLPVTLPARELYLARKLPIYPALSWLNRTRGRGYTLWALYAENLAYFADGRFLGDWNGKASFGRVLTHAGDAISFYRELRRLGANHLLVPARMGGTGPPVDLAVLDREDFRRRFQLVYEDPNARLYALLPLAPAPRL